VPPLQFYTKRQLLYNRSIGWGEASRRRGDHGCCCLIDVEGHDASCWGGARLEESPSIGFGGAGLSYESQAIKQELLSLRRRTLGAGS
jgi:hypothetical protein